MVVSDDVISWRNSDLTYFVAAPVILSVILLVMISVITLLNLVMWCSGDRLLGVVGVIGFTLFWGSIFFDSW